MVRFVFRPKPSELDQEKGTVRGRCRLCDSPPLCCPLAVLARLFNYNGEEKSCPKLRPLSLGLKTVARHCQAIPPANAVDHEVQSDAAQVPRKVGTQATVSAIVVSVAFRSPPGDHGTCGETRRALIARCHEGSGSEPIGRQDGYRRKRGAQKMREDGGQPEGAPWTVGKRRDGPA